MSHVYSRSLLETHSIAGDQGITPSEGEVLIVRDIYIAQPSIVPVDFSVTGSAGQELFGGTLTTSGDSSGYWDRHIVIQPGGQLSVHTLLAPCDLSIFGYALSLP